MLDRVASIIRKLGLWSHRMVIFVFIPALGFIITLDVILRYVFNAPLAWSHDVNGLLLLMAFFASVTHSWNEGRQIRMEVIYNRLKGPFRETANLITILTGMLFFGLLGFRCLQEIPEMIRTGETGLMLMIPLWPFKALMGLFSLLLFLQLLLSLLETFLKKTGADPA